MPTMPLDPLVSHTRLDDLRPTHAHAFSDAEVHQIMDAIYARGDRLMIWFLASHMALALLLALYHGTWVATLSVGGASLGAFALSVRLFPRTFFTRAFAGVAQQAFVALHIYQLYGQSEQHFWYFTAFTMMIVYQDWLCMWPGALLIILQHSIFAALHNAGMPVHFFPETYVGFTKLFYHFGIALVHVSLCGYWAHLLRQQTLGDAWQRLQLNADQGLLKVQLSKLQESEQALQATSDALASSSRQQRAILDNSPDAMWVKDINGRYSAVNSTFARFAGRPMAEIEGRTVEDLLGPREVAEIRQQDAHVIATRKALTVEREMPDEAGVRILEATITPILDAQGNVISTTGLARDVTERRRLEQERVRSDARLQQAQKLESLGLLAGGIAHDFNNLLVGILANAELAQTELPMGSPARVSFVQIEQAAHRAADLTRQMLAYAGKGKVDVLRLDMSAIVYDMADLLRSVLSRKATLRMELGEGLPLVEADATQLRQVIMNLITNASDALNDKEGLITLRTTEVVIENEGQNFPLGQEELGRGRYVVVEVSDTGIGMNADTLARIFDPFFTTKFVGRGLGLAAALGILRAHRGAIDIASAIDQGSTFRVYLPALAASHVVATPVSTDAVRNTPPSERQGLILVVDDESIVRDLAQRVITRAGYTVVCVADGIEAVAYAEKHAANISIVLLDMLMPRMSGEETFRELRRIAPMLPILFSSGYSEEMADQHLLSAGNVAFIQKPYGASQLIRAIDALTGAQATA